MSSNVCLMCHAAFNGRHNGVRFCSNACRRRAWRHGAPVAKTDSTQAAYPRIGLACLLCGRDMGTVRYVAKTGVALIPPYLRCMTCGGTPVVSGDVIYPPKQESCIDLFENDPWRKRMGRPPNKVREARRAHAEKMAS